MTESYWHNQNDPYQYEGSLILRNIPDIKDPIVLEIFEQRASALRLDELFTTIANAPINLILWQTIHRIIFQDVYAWAGEIRTVHLAKGNTVFAMPAHIEIEASRIFDSLNSENIQSLEHPQLISRLAYYFGELNILHPFREGNGRTQKLLFDEIVRRAGHSIDWSKVEVHALLQAVILAFHQQDYSLIEAQFKLSLKKLGS